MTIDNNAMLFNLSTCSHFPNKKTWQEIFCNAGIGPCFGNCADLSAYDEPFNGEGNC
jgi:hypothetical protein